MDQSAIERSLGHVRSFRDTKNYDQMLLEGERIFVALGESTSPQAAHVRSRVHYEYMMAAYKRSEDMPEPMQRYYLRLATAEGQEAMLQGQQSDDPLDEGFALMALSGNVFRKQGKHAIALAQLERMLEKMSALSGVDPARQERLVMNLRLHIVELLLVVRPDDSSTADAIRSHLQALERNETYHDELAKDGSAFARILVPAGAYLDSHT